MPHPGTLFRRPQAVAADPPPYAAWIAAAEPRGSDPAVGAHPAAADVLVSVLLPVHRVPLDYLAAALDSLVAQTSPAWEACVACDLAADEGIARLLDERRLHDPRVRIVRLAANEGISAATNAALAEARGEFVALLDHDDTLAPEALWRMQEAIRARPDADLLYSDKDCLDADGRVRRRPLFKPEWSPEMLYSVNYLTHFNLLRRSLVVDVGGFRRHVDGAQDWDIFFRVAERARSVVRVPGVHYHWRLHEASTSLGGVAAKPYVANAQQVAIQEHLDRIGLPATAEPSAESGFRIRWRVPEETPVHVVLEAVHEAAADAVTLAGSIAAALAALPASTHVPPTRRLTVLAHPGRTTAVEGALAAAGGGPAGIAIEVVAVLPADVARDTRAVVGRHPAAGGALVFVSGRVATAREGWLEALVGWVTCHPEIGFASGLIVGADGNVVECGLVVDRQRRGTPLFRGIPPWQWGWFGGPMWYRNVSAASPWALAVKADAWDEVEGFNPSQPEAGVFVALCRRLRRAGYRGLVEPHARIGLGPGPLPAVPPFDRSVGDDPCFHPAFSSVVPLELASGPAAARLRRPAALRAFPPALAIAGMHRSGTSLVASLVAGAGVSLGERLLGAGRGNERGHFEDLDFQELHQKALRASGFHGDGIIPEGRPAMPPGLGAVAGELVAARRAGDRPWGWKDPRTLLFLDDWVERVPEAGWLLVFRSPWEVADSLFRRLDEPCVSDPLLALRAWRHANRLLLDFARRHPGRCLVRELGQITADPAGTFATLRDRFGLPLGAPGGGFDPALLGGDPAARAEQAAIVRSLLPDADDLYMELRELSGSAVPLPAARCREGDAAGAAAAVSIWARASRERTHAAAALARSIAAERASGVEAVAAARGEGERLLAEERVRSAAALAAQHAECERVLVTQHAECERLIATERAGCERGLAAARAEAARTAAACADTERRVLAAEADLVSRIEHQRHENDALLAEIHRLHRRLDEATGVSAALAPPTPRTIDKVRREAARLARQAREVARRGLAQRSTER